MNSKTDDGSTTYSVPVPEDKAGQRLDRVLADALEGVSRTRLKALIEDGRVSIAGEAAPSPSTAVKAGQVLTVSIPAPEPATPLAQDIPLDVVYEDSELIIINKPAGLVVHPAAGHTDGTLVNALLHHCRGQLSGIGGVSRPGIVHRLDKDTSGLMVAAKTDRTHQDLSEQFAARTVERAYLAVVWGVPSPRRGEIEGNIGRSRANRKKMAVVKGGGKTALTRYKVIRPLGSRAALVECRLATGRTHQIRVHLASIGHPVVGDPLYGGGPQNRLKTAPEAEKNAIKNYKYQALHAYLIGITRRYNRNPLRFEVELPQEIKQLIHYLEVV